jgi:phosphatidate cytidylyltransferase
MSNLTKRILSALVLVPLVLALVFLSSNIFFILGISAVAALAGYEFGSISLSPKFTNRKFVSAFLSFLLTASLSFLPTHPVFISIFLSGAVFLLFFSFMFTSYPVEDAVRSLSFSFFGVTYVGCLMGFIGLTVSSASISSHGRYYIFLLLLGTFLGDTGAYTFGRLFGKHKLAPSLSPKKTWEGAFGGFFSTLLSVFIVRFFFLPTIPIFNGIVLSLFLSVFCQRRSVRVFY